MILEILLSILAGMFCGVFTGLIPGIHVNLISATLVSLSPVLIPVAGILPLAVFIIAMATTHSFLDALPSVFLGAPEAATALGVLPGHRFLLQGEGLLAIKLTILGSLGALTLSAIMFPLLIPFVSFIYPFLQKILVYILISIAVFMIIRDRHSWWALFIFSLAGLLGYLVLNLPCIENPLFPLLSGLFGIATLLVSLNESSSLPKQKQTNSMSIDLKNSIKACASSSFSGFITAVLPGKGWLRIPRIQGLFLDEKSRIN